MRAVRLGGHVPLPFAGKKVLVTGATAGIGAATADRFCREGAEVVAVGRRSDRLEALAAKWADEHAAKVHPVHLDITDRAAVQTFVRRHKRLADVDVLVNNAGLARGVAPMQEADFDDWQEMVDTNVLGLLSLTREVLPFMLKRGAKRAGRAGHIVNLGSVAGRWVYPGGGVYAATKYAVRALSEGLRYDLAGSGVRVTNIEPGLVETEFSLVRFRGDEKRAERVYADADVLRPEDVAEAIYWSCALPPHVNVQEMVLYPTCQAGVRDVVRGGK